MPQDARGLVMFAHGSGSSRYSPRNQLLAQTICDAGIGTLLIDLLTCEEEAVDQITQRLRFDACLLAERLVKATEWINKQADIEHLPVGYFSCSTGGAAALIAAADIGAQIGAVVSRSGRVDLASKALPEIKASTMLVVGEYDDFVLKLNEQAFQSLTCEKEFAVVPGATRRFQEPGALEAVAASAARWFTKYLQPH